VDIDNNVKLGIFVLLAVVFEVFTMGVIADNTHNPQYLWIVGLLAFCFIIMLINNLLVNERPRLLYYLLPAASSLC